MQQAYPEYRCAGGNAGTRELLMPNFLTACGRMTPDALARWQSRIAQSNENVLVVETDSRIVGWATCGPARGTEGSDTGEVYGFYVDPDAWGSGVAYALMDAAVDVLEEQSLRPRIVWVLRDNSRARKFYGRHGFRPDGGEAQHEVEDISYPTLRLRAE